MNEVLRLVGTKKCHGAHVHKDCAVTVDTPDLLVRFIDRDTQSDRGAVTHGADSQEVILMALSVRYTCLEELTGSLTCRGDDRILFTYGNDVLDDFFTDHLVIVLINDLFIVGKSAFSDDESNVFSCCEDLSELIHLRFYFFISCIFSDGEAGDIHIVEKLYRNLTLVDVLRLIVDTGLASPADDKYGRDRVYLIIQKAGDRVDDVTLTAVLHVHDRHLTCREVITSSQGRAVTFICRDHVVMRIDAVSMHQVIAKCFQLGIRNTGIKIRSNDLYKFFYFHDLLLINPRCALRVIRSRRSA